MRHVDALAYLPRTHIVQVPKRTTVYCPPAIPDRLYVVLAGHVRIYRVSERGIQTLLRIVGPEEFFGVARSLDGDRHLARAPGRSRPSNLWRGA